MNYTLILQKALNLVWRYRVLWILGILVALLSGGGNGGGSGANAVWSNGAGPMSLGPGELTAILSVAAVLCFLVLVLALLAIVVRYVAEASLMRSVVQIEESNAAPKFGQAWRLGWNWRAVRLFVIDLLIGLVGVALGIGLFLLAFSPLLLLLIDSDVVRIIGVAVTVVLLFVATLLLIVVIAFADLLKQFVWRSATLDDHGVGEAFRRGWHLLRQRWQNAGIMWLWLLAVSIGYGLVMIPVFFLVGALATALGGGLGWLIYQVTNSEAAAVLFGAPVGLLIFLVPIAIIGGFYTAFRSTAWTLAYREIKALP